LNGGKGLVNAASSGFETGWQSSYAIDVSDSKLSSCVIQPGQTFAGSYSTWTTNAGTNETRPINCVTWYDAYAFCIWDGGFLPSEAEIAYVQAAGAEQREYPWGSTDPGTANQYAIYGCNYPPGASGTCSGATNLSPVGTAPLGEGSLEHLDLAGDVFAWTLDDYSAYLNPAGGCVDCANLSGGTSKAIRGGAFVYGATSLLSYSRSETSAGLPNGSFGIRCARAP
jgi:formylglycine-generating enzyme required for sulfatase activity